jgi:redox-sensitive bicupin YhaK (pirin superfamily)
VDTEGLQHLNSRTRDESKGSAVEREIARVYPAPALHWVGDGFRVMGYFSAESELVRTLSPFLLLDYHPRPHRGFETVTMAFEGAVAHDDSAGHSGVVEPGDVHWVTAGAGILHREYHEENFGRRGGRLHMVQLWINLPKVNKLAPPGYQAIEAEQISAVNIPNAAGMVRVIAGQYQGVKGPAKTFTPIDLFDVRLMRKGRLEFSFPAHHNAALLLMDGNLAIHGTTKATTNDLVLFANVGEQINILAEEDAHVLVLSGAPIDEPMVQRGPFVMNSEREIQEAIAEFEGGGFGRLEP